LAADGYEKIRSRMVEEQLIPRGITDPRVLQAMGRIPRHLFVAEPLRVQAYGDFSLPIGEGQTISQPYIVALMTELLELSGPEKVLEVGTGCGYQSAVLATLCDQVYTVERIKPLLARARKNFDRLGLYNILSKADDGTAGWPEHAPFDRIIVTAAGPEVPEPLVNQLADPGRMVMPVGDRQGQVLVLVRKEEGGITVREVEEVKFVKLVGEHGWEAA